VSSAEPDRIRREIEHTQADLSRDVDALASKITPRRIVRRRVHRVKGAAARWKETVMGVVPTRGTPVRTGTHISTDDSGRSPGEAMHRMTDAIGDAASSAGATARQAPQAIRRQARGNPIAAGVIAFGTGWLVASLIPAARREQDVADRAVRAGREKVQAAGPAVQQAAAEVRDNLREPAQQAVESLRSTGLQAGRAVADDGRARAEEVQERARDAAENVRER